MLLRTPCSCVADVVQTVMSCEASACNLRLLELSSLIACAAIALDMPPHLSKQGSGPHRKSPDQGHLIYRGAGLRSKEAIEKMVDTEPEYRPPSAVSVKLLIASTNLVASDDHTQTSLIPRLASYPGFPSKILSCSNTAGKPGSIYCMIVIPCHR